MILVDTSVMIDFLKGVDNWQTQLFHEIIEQGFPFGISAYTYQELLQGARDSREFAKLKEYLSSQTVYFLPNELLSYEKAAMMSYGLRRNGRTPRSSIDILIAQTAVHFNLSLLHNDRDFDNMAGVVDGLKIVKSF